MKRLEISGQLLARNTLLNLIGQAVPLVVGVVTIPFIVKGLGTERFGLLSLAWVVLGYFAIFDLGLGRATTKFVAEALGRGKEDEIPRIVWTAVTVQAILGIVGGLVLAGITPLLVEHVLKIPPELLAEAKATFYLLALSVPVVLVSGSFSGVLEASQRFDLVNAVRVPSNALNFLLSLLGLFLGFRLPGIVGLILATKFVALAALVALAFRVAVKLRKFASSFNLFPYIFAYSGWIMVTNVVNPILIYLDRFLISSFLSMAVLAYYSVPYELATRFQIIPGSLTMTLFPAFSALEGIEDRQKLGAIFARSLKYILLFLGPIVIVLTSFGQEIMQLWLGQDFARESAGILQILAVGVLINSMAYVPSSLLSGAGRPDIPAKFHLLELPVYIGIAWLLIKQNGSVGAAEAWTLRVSLDALLLFLASFRVYRFSFRLLVTNSTLLTALAFVLSSGLVWLVKIFLANVLPFSVQILVLLSITCLFGYFCWAKALDSWEHEAFRKIAMLWRR